MTYEVLWSDEALSLAQSYLGDDRPGLIDVFDAVDLLADNPRPRDAFAWGGDRFRLRVGRYRVLYEVTHQTVTIDVIHLART